MGINVRAHIEPGNNNNHNSIQELMEHGFDVHINDEASLHDNMFGVIYTGNAIEQDCVSTSFNCDYIKDLMNHMTMYVYDGDFGVYVEIVDVLPIESENVWEIHTVSKAVDIEDLLTKHMPVRNSIHDVKPAYTENVNIVPRKPNPLDSINLKRKLRF